MRLSHACRSMVLSALVVLIFLTASFAQVGISITIGPPALPVYAQPLCPDPGYMWVPGYWAWGPYGYYWVPGTWVFPPAIGLLWTPGWWGWGGAAFIWHVGYWGPQIGFYGGINYGFGYFGHGYDGGRWENGNFFYNRTVNNVNVTNITNVYNTTVVNNNVNRVSYNGGEGGIEARPTAEEQAAERDKHIGPTSVQTHQEHAALTDPQLRASENHGKPPIAATPRAGAFKDGVEPAKEAGGSYRPENNVPRPPNASGVIHAKDLPPHQRGEAPNTGDQKLDQKNQEEQNKLYEKQEQEHQKMVQQQERDHQQAEQRQANEAEKQQMEQKHQQQTQQMEERHAQEQEHLQARQQPRAGGGGHPH